MTYQCGIGGGMARLGFRPCEPHIVCDGCGVTRPICGQRTCGPQAWFLRGKAAPKWSGGRRADHTREDWCPACTAVRAIAAQVREALKARGLPLTRENVQAMKVRLEAYFAEQINTGALRAPGVDIEIAPGAAPGEYLVNLRLQAAPTQELNP